MHTHIHQGSRKFIIAGGGTGGHIFPAIAIANALKELDPNASILFVGAIGKMEMEKVPQAGYPIVGLPIAGYNRSAWLKNVSLPLKLIKSFLQVRSLFKSFQPTAVIGVGGYATFPVLKYAQAKGIPTFIHEANSFAGKSNQLLAKQATQIFVASENMETFFPKEKILITGNPVRKSIANLRISKESALAFFKLSPQKQTVLVLGGSLGARSINEAIAAGMDQLLANGLQLIWQTGANSFEQYQAAVMDLEDCKIFPFIKEMDMAFAAADLVVSRSGAMSVTELTITQKPTVFVPFPHAAEDHQTFNAMSLVKKGAALLVKDAEAKEQLVPTLLELANNEPAQQEMKTQLAKIVQLDTDKIIAQEILKHS